MRISPEPILLALALLMAGCSSNEAAPALDPGTEPEPAAPEVVVGQVDSFDGVPIHYESRGAGLHTLVFLHGWCGNRGYWREQLPVFAREYRVVAIDLAGHGDSGTHRSDWSVANFARDVEAVVKHLGLNHIVLIGHSTSGPVAMEAAVRLGMRVQGVIGVDTLHDVAHGVDPAAIETTLGRLRREYSAFVSDFVRSQCLPQTDPALVARLTEEMGRTDPLVAISCLAAFAKSDQMIGLSDCPVRVFCINADALRRTHVDSNRRFNSSFDAVVMPGVGHFLMLEQPQAFNTMLNRALAPMTLPRG